MNTSTVLPTCDAAVAAWNARHGEGTAVRTALRPGALFATRTPALVLFGHRAAVYLEGCNGYFELADVHALAVDTPLQPAAGTGSGITVMFPGQGAQHKGMGRALFARYPALVRQASEVLGFAVEALCLEDAQGQLAQTQFTQPALYVVGALGWQALCDDDHPAAHADFLLGHSLGEFNALQAAGVFDFETGLRLVARRGQLMAAAGGGGMAAVLGADPQRIRELLRHHGLDDVDLSNFNTPRQSVIAGPADAMARAYACLSTGDELSLIPLKVSAAFHSRHMAGAQAAFAEFLQGFQFAAPRIPVIANASARPYEADAIVPTLCAQIASPVRWTDSIRHALARGQSQFVEIGSTILSAMVAEIRGAPVPTTAPPERRQRSP